MHILVCSPSYPTRKTIDFVFVDNLCRAFADLGNAVTVIAPQSITKCLFRHIPLMPSYSRYYTANGASIDLYRPYMVTLSNSRFAKLFNNSFQYAVNRAYKRLKTKPDVCYGHFWSSIFALYPLAKNHGIPLFGASGEENVSLYVHKNEAYKNELRKQLCGVISVSSKNQKECLDQKLIEVENSIVIPNAIDHKLFRKLNKKLCREQFGISEEDFVVAFVGQFVPRKGTLRLNAALKIIGEKQIKAIFIGSGCENPDYEGIIYKGRVAHDDVPRWLNAADVFVLPTENEGCCNAIIEAMACGLPVVSSDLAFNYDIMNDGNGIMVDCHDIKAIAEAITCLKNDEALRLKLSKGALTTAAGLLIEKRAAKIIEFMNEKILK